MNAWTRIRGLSRGERVLWGVVALATALALIGSFYSASRAETQQEAAKNEAANGKPTLVR